MLALAAHPLGVPLSVLTANAQDPAAQVCGATQFGSLEDENDLKRFLPSLGAVTFESEFVNTAKLAKCLPKDVKVFPSLDAIEAIQDRLSQKQLLGRYKIPTAPWMEVSNAQDLKEAKKKFPRGFVLKQRRFGYDGYGTFVFKNGKGDDSALLKSSHGFIAEEFIPFKRELAFSIVRSNSQSRTLPLVESVQVNSRCYSVCGPIKHPKLRALEKLALSMMTSLEYIGVLAFELFEGPKGALLVNELAPRVHNSAHYSQDALTCSQFEYHIRAGLDWPLPEVELVRKGFAMINLLGTGGKVNLSRKHDGFLHWYGKNENRAGRKMGHINTLASTPKAALKSAEKWRKDFEL
jgi:5-(carboxyamino)imidazole ribonucleotide synthase